MGNPRVLPPCRHADLNVKVNGEWGVTIAGISNNTQSVAGIIQFY
ncbi:hypothetical protein [Ferruginibacter sp.]|nr:hypothetical protein [Ferruginibacter sp.]